MSPTALDTLRAQVASGADLYVSEHGRVREMGWLRRAWQAVSDTFRSPEAIAARNDHLAATLGRLLALPAEHVESIYTKGPKNFALEAFTAATAATEAQQTSARQALTQALCARVVRENSGYPRALHGALTSSLQAFMRTRPQSLWSGGAKKHSSTMLEQVRGDVRAALAWMERRMGVRAVSYSMVSKALDAVCPNASDALKKGLDTYFTSKLVENGAREFPAPAGTVSPAMLQEDMELLVQQELHKHPLLYTDLARCTENVMSHEQMREHAASIEADVNDTVRKYLLNRPNKFDNDGIIEQFYLDVGRQLPVIGETRVQGADTEACQRQGKALLSEFCPDIHERRVLSILLSQIPGCSMASVEVTSLMNGHGPRFLPRLEDPGVQLGLVQGAEPEGFTGIAVQRNDTGDAVVSIRVPVCYTGTIHNTDIDSYKSGGIGRYVVEVKLLVPHDIMATPPETWFAPGNPPLVQVAHMEMRHMAEGD